MARYIGQIQGEYNPNFDLMVEMHGKRIEKVVKIGVQLANDYLLKINGKFFEMGKTGILEYEDVEITELSIRHKDNQNLAKIPVIIDYVCEVED